MITLGIDPGSRISGYAFIANGKLLHSGVLQFAEIPFPERLRDIQKQTAELLKSIKPDAIAVEALIFHKNPDSLAKLAQARGAILATLMAWNVPVFEYAPNQVKSVTTGSGHVTKEGLQKFLKLALKMDKEFTTADESDAVAIALTHSLLNPQNQNQHIIPRTSGRGGSLKQMLNHKIKDSPC
jgi:crossover junction endodeoxyribonuclease RuvC